MYQDKDVEKAIRVEKHVEKSPFTRIAKASWNVSFLSGQNFPQDGRGEFQIGIFCYRLSERLTLHGIITAHVEGSS